MGHYYTKHHGERGQVGDGAMTRGYAKLKHEKIWYVIEECPDKYKVRSGVYVQYDMPHDERLVNEEPLTWQEAEVFRKLLTGVQS